MDAISLLKNQDLVAFVGRFLKKGKGTGKNSVWFHRDNKDKTASLEVFLPGHPKTGYTDHSKILGGGSIIDFYMNLKRELGNSMERNEVIVELLDLFGIKGDKQEFKKAPKRFVLVEKFEDFKIKEINNGFLRFLNSRGFSESFYLKNKKNINSLACEFGYIENLWIASDGKKSIYKDCIILPSRDENFNIVGAKLRTIDGTKFQMGDREIKSVSIGKGESKSKIPFSTGLLYKKEDLGDVVYITEGGPDYMVLKALGFKSVIGNLGGVGACAEQIKHLLKHTKTIICLYDNDNAGIRGAKLLESKIGRPIRKIIYPEIDGVDKYDINDLFKMGFLEKDFKKLFDESILLKDIKEQGLLDGRFFYDEYYLEYFDIQRLVHCSRFVVSSHLFMSQKELEELRQNNEVPIYKGVCYFDGGKKGYYNLLTKESMLHPNNKPQVNEHIEFLIKNICNNNFENINWFLKAIIYKYTHLNDVYIPAVIFHGVGGTGKGLLMKLLSKIFGEENTLIGQTQDNLESKFSTYTGQKLIVEMKELAVDNTAKGKRNMQKLKTIIMEDKIITEKKGKDPVSTENIAWFIMSSNDNRPVLLDPSDSGNRRFSIIKTGGKISKEKGKAIAKAINNIDNIESFLAWLLDKFKNINELNYLEDLENEDKETLERLCEPVGNLFFKWFEEKFPNINYLTNFEFKSLLDTYCIINDEDRFNDARFKKVNFNNGLSMRYNHDITPFRKKINGKNSSKTYRGYKINKEVIGDGHFPVDADENYFSEKFNNNKNV